MLGFADLSHRACRCVIEDLTHPASLSIHGGGGAGGGRYWISERCDCGLWVVGDLSHRVWRCVIEGLSHPACLSMDGEGGAGGDSVGWWAGGCFVLEAVEDVYGRFVAGLAGM